MEQILCKICGQPLVEVRKGFYKCSGCLSEFKKEASVSAEQKQLQESYELIRKGNFSDAEAICSTLIKANENSYEAYWVRALAKNGVIFVRDIGDRMVPTCQNIVEEQFLSDTDVKKAIELAPTEIAENYKTQGERIEAIRKEWFEMASKEAPYDVFICFKDSDKENGMTRTRDSEYAQDMYNYLCTKGLNVFFSRVSLMGKVSEHYEPYIYNALKTAKVMIVYGEKAEYFNSTWLKNEWSRFIARMNRENMPKDSLIVAYRGVDPYRIPSALLGGRQGLDLTKPSAFNILVEKVVDTVAKAKKVITLERKEIKGGQMSKKASTIMQAEIQKRTIGAKTPVKLDFSLESKLQMVQNYLNQGMWQEAEENLSVVLDQAPHNGYALTCKLLLKTKNKNMNDLMNSEHFTDTTLLQTILDSADQETAQKLLDTFYEFKSLPISEYRAILKTILPYEYSNRPKHLEAAFQDALTAKDTETFDLLLQALDSNEVDRYIDLNKSMLINLLDTKSYEQARKYISNILSVNEGNLDILRVDCEISLVTNDGQFIDKFENLLKYAKDTNKYVKFFVEKILEDRKVTESESAVLKKILAYYKGEFIELKDSLLTITAILILGRHFKDAEYFDNLILAEDAKCADAWLYLCLIGTQSTTIAEMSNSDAPINKCRGFDEYCSLVDAEKQKAIFNVLKEQQGKLAEKNQKIYDKAVNLQKDDNIGALEHAIETFTSILGFKDSEQHIVDCEKRIEEIKNAQIEAREARNRAKKKAAKVAKLIAICAAAVALIVILTITLFIPMIRMNQADKLFASGNYTEADKIYKDLGSFGKSEQRAATVESIDKLQKNDLEGGIKKLLEAGVPVELTYNTEGGSLANTETISTGYILLSQDNSPSQSDENNVFTLNQPSDFSSLKIPGRNGYRFVEWVLDTYSYNVKTKDATFCLAVKAIWSTKDYTVDYDLAGGEISSENIVEYDPEDEAFTLINPTRTGYTFAGWVGTNLSEPQVNVTVPTGSYGNRTYTATWTANEYTVTYDAAGGTVSSATQTVAYDSNVEYLIPERTGYTFLGWYENETKYENEKWTRTSDLTLIAKWEIIGYTIGYEMNDGTNHGENPTNYNVDTDTITLKDPSRTGYTFTGWTYEGQTTPTKNVTIEKGSVGNKTFTANWEAITTTITFNANSGVCGTTELSATYDKEFTLPEVTRSGYTFLGWFNNGTKYESGTWKNYTNMELTAEWEIISYSITYELAGGTNAGNNPTSYTVEQTISLEDPSRTGYRFTGWTYEGQSTPTKVVTIAKGTTGEKTYTANWEAISSTITLNPNGGSCDPITIPVTYDQEFTLPDCVWAGHTFSGWYVGDTKITGGICKIYEDTTLVADWDVIQYTVSYTMNGGTNAGSNPTSYNYHDTFTLADPVRTGYTFLGWTFEGQTSPTKNVTIALGTTGDKSYTANWQAISSTITFNANGGVCDKESIIATYDQSYTLPTPEWVGHTFLGWYENGTKITSGICNFTSGKSLTAKWSAIEYTISYSMNGGINAGSNPTSYNYHDSFTLADPTKTGYTFLGWTYEGQSTPTKNVTVVVGTTGDLVYTANWQANTYTVTLDANGGTVSPTTLNATFDTIVTLPTPERTGYRFDGWFVGTKQYTSGTWKTDSEVTLKAKWAANTYKATYDANGGSVSSSYKNYTYDSSYSLLEPERTGYEFLGWYKDGIHIPQTGTWKFDTNISLVAEWRAITYTVTYDAGMGTSSANSAQATYDSDFTLATAERIGYTFGGWYYNGTKYSNGTWKTAQTITLTAKWTANTNTEYTVNHHLQNINDDGYTLDQSQTLYGTSDAFVTPSVKSYTGFTSPSSQSVTILPDGSRVLNYYYTRNYYTLTLVANGGTGTQIRQKYQSALTPNTWSTRENYTLGGWYTNVDLTSSFSYSTMPASNMTIYAYWTEENKPSDFTYSGTTDITITGYNSTDTTVVVPSYIGGKAVKSISQSAFANKTSITKITIPDTVQTISEAAFAGCISLEELILPFIGSDDYSSSAASYSMVNSASYPWSIDSNGVITSTNKSHSSSSTYKIVASKKCTLTFQYKTSSESGYDMLTIYKNGTQIAQTSGTPSYTSLTVELEAGDNLTFTYSKDGSTSNGSDCAYIKGFGDSSSSHGYNLGYLFGKTNVTGTTKVIQNNVEYFLPSSLRKITSNTLGLAENAFENCIMLEEIHLPEISTIETNAFKNCTALKRFNSNTDGVFNIPVDVTEIGSYAFYGCSHLVAVNMGNNITKIGSWSFGNCSAMNKFNSESSNTLIIPDGVQTIGSYTFINASHITDIIVPNGVTTIGSGAFNGCNSLVNITLPFIGRSEAETTARWAVFGYIFGDDSPEDDNMASSSTTYLTSGSYGFTTQIINSGSKWFYFVIPQSLRSVTITNQTDIPEYAFINCDLIETINIPTSVNNIGTYAFTNCKKLSKFNSDTEGEMILPQNIVIIGEYEFRNLSSITKIVVPNSVTTIGRGAFYGCTALEDITIPFIGSTVTNSSIPYTFGYIFDYVYTDRSPSGTICQYSLGTPNGSQFYYCYYIPTTIRSVTITMQTAIPENAFKNCYFIENITLPSTITSIGEYAFYNCKGITEMNLGASLTTIGQHAFDKCISLEKITMPNSVANMGSYVFSGCIALKRMNSTTDGVITLPTSLTVIPSYVFNGCTEITKVVVGDITTIESYAFSGCESITQFNSDIEGELIIPSGVKTLGTYAFQQLSSITKIVVPNSVTIIGQGAFKGCTTLEDITIPFIGSTATNSSIPYTFGYIFDYVYTNRSPSGTICQYSLGTPNGSQFYYCYYIPTTIRSVTITMQTVIPEYAFKNCSFIESITLPSTITSIGEYAFHNCKGITEMALGVSLTSIGKYAFDSTSLKNVFYLGSESDWNKINIVSNDCLTKATRYYYSESYIEGNYWHYVDGVPTPWVSEVNKS